jgi:hypothetical protein
MALWLTCTYSLVMVVTPRSSSWATDTASLLMKAIGACLVTTGPSGLEPALQFVRRKSELRGVRFVPITEEKARGLCCAMSPMSIISENIRVVSQLKMSH